MNCGNNFFQSNFQKTNNINFDLNVSHPKVNKPISERSNVSKRSVSPNKTSLINKMSTPVFDNFKTPMNQIYYKTNDNKNVSRTPEIQLKK